MSITHRTHQLAPTRRPAMSFRRASHSPSVTQTQLQAQTLPPQRLKRPDFCRYSSHVVPHHRPALSRRFSEIPLVLPLTPQELAHAEQAQAAPPPPPPPQQQPPKRPSLTRYKSHVVSDSFSWSPSSFFRRKTYREAKAQKLALIALAAVSLISIALVLHAWLVSTVSHVEIVITPRAAVRGHAPPVPVSGDSGASAGAPHPRHQHKRVPDGAPAFAFTEPAIEFGALVNFLAAFASNALPVTIDPAQPLDPDLVLGFNPRGAGAKEEVRGHVQDAWMRNPVVVFSDVRRNTFLSRTLY